MAEPLSPVGRTGRGWVFLVLVSAVFGSLALLRVVWSVATGGVGAAAVAAAGLAFWYWIGVGALRRYRSAS